MMGLAPMPKIPSLSNPQAIAEAGEKIYREKYQARFEEEHLGKFVAINVLTEEAYLGDLPEEAFQKAREAAPKGLLHLIRIGSPGAFRVSYSSNAASSDWIFRQPR